MVLSLSDVETRCSEFLREQLDISNCLGIRRFAETHSCPGLMASAEAFCLAHFSEITRVDEFLDLRVDELNHLICRDNLEVRSMIGC